MFSVTEKVQELLLCKKTLDLQKTVDICHAHELTSKQTKEMAGAHVDKVTSSRHMSLSLSLFLSVSVCLCLSV